MLALLQRLWNDEQGQGMVEYGLIIALVSVVVVALLATMGDQLVLTFQNIVDALTGA